MTGVWPEGEEEFVLQAAKKEGVGREEVIPKLSAEWEGSSWTAAGFKNKKEQVYDEARLRKCVKKLESFEGREGVDARTGWMAMEKGSVLVKALEIAIVLREQSANVGNNLPDVDEILKWIAGRLHANQMISSLTESEKSWMILKDGALAKAVGVKDELIKELGSNVLETFRIRYEEGVQRSEMWEKSIEELLHVISENTMDSPATKILRKELYGAEEGKKRKPPTTILKDALPRKEGAELEERLGTALPEDYKAFLGITNGMDSSWNGISNDPPLYPASEVRWITNAEPYFTDLDAQLLPGALNLLRDVYNKGKWPKVGTPLWIGLYDIYCVWLLPPVKVKELIQLYLTGREKSPEIKAALEKAMIAWAGDLEAFEKLEWCVLTWASGGAAHMEAYPSFRAYLVSRAEKSGRNLGDRDDVERACFSYSCR